MLLELATPGQQPEFIPADLVVDAAGRGTLLPVWLSQWGYRRPTEQTVDVGITYSTQKLRIPEGLLDESIVIVGTAFGVANAKPPPTFDGMRELAAALPPARFAAGLAQAKPIGSAASHAYPVSRWRRYDKLRRFPTGIVPVGDAVASFNPTCGQGMTMASLQAGHLRRALEFSDRKLARKLNRATARTIYPVWMSDGIAMSVITMRRPVHHAFGGDSLCMVPSPAMIGCAIVNYVRVWLRALPGYSA